MDIFSETIISETKNFLTIFFFFFFFLHFLNLDSILNIFNKNMILIADGFLNLRTPKNVVS